MKKQLAWVLVCLLTIASALGITQWFSRTVTVMAENAPVIRSRFIVIDAGHGGVDGGATSCTGRLESTYNLEIAIRLNDLLQLLGYQTIMIRTTDVSVYTSGDTIAAKKISDLKERVRIANERQNTILLSIHQNYFPDDRYSGAVVLYANTNGSRELAEAMQKKIVEALNPGSKRQVRKADGVYLMEHIQCTGILIECGFLSNHVEEALLSNADYQKKLCCVIAATVAEAASKTHI